MRQPGPVPEYEIEPAVDPPLAVKVSKEPNVPETDVTDNAD